MKLSFSSITLGGGPNYFLTDWKGLDGDLDNVIIKIPRTDYSREISDYLSTKIRTFTGTLLGNSANDFRTKKLNLVNLLRQDFTFTLVDDYKNSDGSITVFGTYQFNGKIISFDANQGMRSNLSEYTLQIVSEDPMIYSSTLNTFTSKIHMSGFIFPLVFPLLFASTDNQMSINNTNTAVYPTITITGPLTNLTVKNETTGEFFTYTGTLTSTDQLVITPIIPDPIKIRKNGVSVLSSCNANWDTFLLSPGVTVLTFLLDSGEDTTTSAVLTYRDAYIGI